jgi:hypothetical protein
MQVFAGPTVLYPSVVYFQPRTLEVLAASSTLTQPFFTRLESGLIRQSQEHNRLALESPKSRFKRRGPIGVNGIVDVIEARCAEVTVRCFVDQTDAL